MSPPTLKIMDEKLYHTVNLLVASHKPRDQLMSPPKIMDEKLTVSYSELTGCTI